MSTRAEQLDFLFALFRPLLTLGEAAFLLDDASERHVLDLLDEGRVRGVNIATVEDTRRTLRIYRWSVEHIIFCPAAPLTSIDVDQLLPHHRPTILRRELASWLACTEQHISNLDLDGPRTADDTRHRIHRAAILNFLRNREV